MPSNQSDSEEEADNPNIPDAANDSDDALIGALVQLEVAGMDEED